MNITNRFNLPVTLLNAVKDDEYDRGDSVLSVTQLISSPRIVLLQDLNAGNLTADVVDRVPALLGTAVHKIIEKGSKDIPSHIVEERLFAEILGWKISGAVDLQIDNGDGTWEINDYKVTSVYSVMDEKIEWIQQLNLYAFLARQAHGRSVTRLRIIAILRDWQRKQAEMKPDYPQSQVLAVDIPLWTDEQQSDFVHTRVALHQEAKKMVDSGGAVPYCTDQERWLRGETWAVMKEGRKSAVRLHDSEEEARDTAERLGAGHSVEHRPGSPIRCAGNYSMGAQWCRQYQEELGRSTG